MKNESHLEEKRLQGLSIVPGIAIGHPFFSDSEINIKEVTVPYEEIENEIKRYYKALRNSQVDLASIKDNMSNKHEKKELRDILKSHLEIIKDPLITERVVKGIRQKQKNAEYIFTLVLEEIEEKLQKVKKPFFSERLQDIQDVSKRIIGYLCCQEKKTFSKINKNLIIFSKNISPSDAVEANGTYIKAFVTEMGTATSHMAIISRVKGIPFVSNIKIEFVKKYCSETSFIIVNGSSGEIIFNPKNETLEKYFIDENKKSLVVTKSLNQRKVFVKNNLAEIFINVSSVKESLLFKEVGARGVGLFRSEYLVLEKKGIPSEKEQYQVYSELIKNSKEGSPPVIRAFDLGLDKICDSLKPLVGSLRGMRFLLSQKEIFSTQLKALLRSSFFGQVKFLLPLVIDKLEIIETKELLKTLSKELLNKGHSIDYSNISIGCMIETPASIFLIDSILSESEFCSIGTNDLIQYSLGVQRTGVDEEELLTQIHPSILEMIKQVISAAKRKNISVSICGEIANNLLFLPLFVGMGIESFSVSLPFAGPLKERLCLLKKEKVDFLVEEVSKMSSFKDIKKLLENFEKSLFTSFNS